MSDVKVLRLPDAKIRHEIKRLAEEARLSYGLKGIFDIFKIIESVALFIRLPLDNLGCSGFTTYLNNTFAVFINSGFTLGHERFSCAHELYHIRYDSDILKKDGMVPESKKENEKDDEIDKADVFAAEFLMPEELVIEQFWKLVDVKPNEVEARHIVRMFDYFGVSYTAMLKRLIQIGLCAESKYNSLLEYSNTDNIANLESIIKAEDADLSIVKKSRARYISKSYLEAARDNYEKQSISYDKLEELLDYFGMKPEQFGYKPNWVDEV